MHAAIAGLQYAYGFWIQPMIDDLRRNWHGADVGALDLSVAGSLARELAPADFGRIVESFAIDIDRLADEMEAGVRAGDSLAVRRAAHGLAGAAAAVGAATLEQAARVGLEQGPYPAGFIAAVRRTGTEAMQELRALLQGRQGCA